jgi:cellulose synthase/poly-beta-1,6-N-acetylglucosamine synthase-like glycosyltransferase
MGSSSTGGVVELEPGDARRRLVSSIRELYDSQPRLSAYRLIGRRALGVLFVAVLGLGAAIGLAHRVALEVLVAIATVIFTVVITYRIVVFTRSIHAQGMLHVSEDDARAIPDNELPVYTVLVPAFRELELIGQVVDSLKHLEYPEELLDVKLLLEADDLGTIEAAKRAVEGTRFDIVLVPAAEPRTKPKALNFGLSLARGELVTIYDVEDRPDPLQLRRAVVAFRRAPKEVACLQANLSYANVDQNLLTKWFTIEYANWFALFLPGLVSLGAPLPLGGTSNHIRRAVLEELGAWDPFNVTEDADLGIRLHRKGYRSAVLDSITYEEANSDFVNWAKQRSRWYKGYLQTWLVHMRRPRQLWRDLGPSGFFQFNLFIGGGPILALISPIFWTLTAVYFAVRPAFIQTLFAPGIYYLALACWLLGNAAMLYLNVLTVRIMDRPSLLRAALLTPLYWLAMSVAAVKAVIQLVSMPSYWEKTTHGLDVPPVLAEQPV